MREGRRTGWQCPYHVLLRRDRQEPVAPEPFTILINSFSRILGEMSL